MTVNAKIWTLESFYLKADKVLCQFFYAWSPFQMFEKPKNAFHLIHFDVSEQAIKKFFHLRMLTQA